MKSLPFLFMWLLVASASQARIITVDNDGPADFHTIQAAIDDASDGDVVVVSPGTYTGDGNRDIDFKGKAITVRSIGPDDPTVVVATILDCDATAAEHHRGFHFHRGEGPNSVVAGLTITNGRAPTGAGILSARSNPTIRRCLITGNSAVSTGPYGLTAGGGIYCDDSTRIIDCTITRNSASFGGGIHCSYDSSPEIIGCIVVENSAGEGGGIYDGDSTSEATLANCVVIDNQASRGSGIFSEGCLRITNSIIWDNEGADITIECWGCVNSYLVVSYSDVQGGHAGLSIDPSVTVNWGKGNIDADPLFVNPAAGDYHLSANSPCIESGDPCYSPAPGQTDIDSQPRLTGDRVDMGVDEFGFLRPFIGVSDTHFVFRAMNEGHNPEAQSLFIRNLGTAIISWEITEDCLWLDISPRSGTSGGDVNELALGVDISALDRGLHTCELSITADGAANSPKAIRISLYNNDEIDVPSEYATIQTAIDGAVDGDTVIIAPGTYTGDGNRDLDFCGKAITVRSEDPCDPDVVAATVVDCQGHGRGFCFRSGEGPDSVVAGLKIGNGRGPDEYFGPGTRKSTGGAIYGFRSSPTIERCQIRDNKAYRGGAIAFRGHSRPTISGCTIMGNLAYDYGGGLAWYDNCAPTISNCIIVENSATEEGGGIHGADDFTVTYCTISGNSASHGGGIYCDGGSPEITRCSINVNSATEDGGGICCDSSWVTIEDCVMAENVADRDGGAIYYDYVGQTSLYSSLLAANSAKNGGAIYVHASHLRVSHCLITGNSADDKGGGVCSNSVGHGDWMNHCTFTNNSATYGGAICGYYVGGPDISNCILWADTAQFGPEIAVTGRKSHVTVSYSDVEGGLQAGYVNVEDECTLDWGQGNIDADPCFATSGRWDANGTPGDPSDDYWVTGDYHLKSQAGRWDPNSQTWIQDDVTSRCIDAGDMGSPIGYEPFPSGGIVNMGAYGGTAEASKSYFGDPLCKTVIAGDINGDCRIDYLDFALMSLHWLEGNSR